MSSPNTPSLFSPCPLFLLAFHLVCDLPRSGLPAWAGWEVIYQSMSNFLVATALKKMAVPSSESSSCLQTHGGGVGLMSSYLPMMQWCGVCSWVGNHSCSEVMSASCHGCCKQSCDFRGRECWQGRCSNDGVHVVIGRNKDFWNWTRGRLWHFWKRLCHRLFLF